MIFKILIFITFIVAINSIAIKLYENGNVDYIVGLDNFDGKNNENVLDKFQATIESTVNSSKDSMQKISNEKDVLLEELSNEWMDISENDVNYNAEEIEDQEFNINASYQVKEKDLLQKYEKFESQLASKKQEFVDEIQKITKNKENELETCEGKHEMYEDLPTCEEVSQYYDSQINTTKLEAALKAKIIEKEMKALKEDIKDNLLNYQVSLNQLYRRKFLQMEAAKVKSEKVQVVYKNTIKFYEKHTERVEGLLETLQGNVTEISEKFLENKVTYNLDIETANDCSWKRWNDLSTDLDENAVIGGNDVDGTPLYVIRARTEESLPFSYGKFAVKRSHAYITDDQKEFGVRNFEVNFFNSKVRNFLKFKLFLAFFVQPPSMVFI